MKRAILTFCTFFCLNLIVFARPQAMVKPVSEGKDAAMKWLVLVDEGEYGKSWDLSAKPFQTSVTKADWIVGMNRARRFYGKVLSRKFEDSIYAANPPGFAPGEYEILHFKVRLAMKGQATEVVSMELQSNGKWLVAGYHIALKDQIRVRPLEFLDHRGSKFLGRVFPAQVRRADLLFARHRFERLHDAPAGFGFAQMFHHQG
jgi:Protein of unknown function (DUF4019)